MRYHFYCKGYPPKPIGRNSIPRNRIAPPCKDAGRKAGVARMKVRDITKDCSLGE